MHVYSCPLASLQGVAGRRSNRTIVGPPCPDMEFRNFDVGSRSRPWKRRNSFHDSIACELARLLKNTTLLQLGSHIPYKEGNYVAALASLHQEQTMHIARL